MLGGFIGVFTLLQLCIHFCDVCRHRDLTEPSVVCAGIETKQSLQTGFMSVFILFSFIAVYCSGVLVVVYFGLATFGLVCCSRCACVRQHTSA